MNKQIRKEQIIQLREHDLNRGHDKSRTPVYPMTVPEAIIGLENTGGVTKITSLPEGGEPGVIYYNETDNKYYVYEGSNWVNTDLNSGAAQVLYTQPGAPQGIAYDSDTVASIFPYYIERDAYNILIPFSEDGLPYEGYVGVRLVPSENDDRLVNYVGRFTVPTPNTFFQLQLPSTVGIPDDDDFVEGNGFEPGHVYEFNILHDTCMIKDITCAALETQREREANLSDVPEQSSPGGVVPSN